jgi:hypothetical protein
MLRCAGGGGRYNWAAPSPRLYRFLALSTGSRTCASAA